jgi:murein DD-endopeptidase MepM/ murein hydrolase activator NlpD
MGTPLYSIVEGTVIHAGDTPYQSPEYYCGEDDREGYMDYPPYGFGHYVTIETADHTCRVYYAHMQRGSIQVSVGDSVEPGTLLGGMGGTGCSWGVHLHLEVRCLNNGKYEVVDPGIFMGGRTGGYD